jgi:hypothetical protein
MDSLTAELQWEQLEIPGLFEQLPNLANESEEDDETEDE